MTEIRITRTIKTGPEFIDLEKGQWFWWCNKPMVKLTEKGEVTGSNAFDVMTGEVTGFYLHQNVDPIDKIVIEAR